MVGVAGAGITGLWVWQGRALPGGGCVRGGHYRVVGVAGAGITGWWVCRGGHYRVVAVSGAGINGWWVWQGRALPGGGCGKGGH